METEIRYGSIVRRLAAAAIDAVIIGAVIAVVALQQPVTDTPGLAVGLLVLGSAIAMFYRMVSEGSRLRATPGKYLLGLAAVHADGRPMMFVGSALRSWPWWLTGAVAALAPSLMLPAAGVCIIVLVPILWDEQRRGLHDRMAGTVVVMRDAVDPAGTSRD